MPRYAPHCFLSSPRCFHFRLQPNQLTEFVSPCPHHLQKILKSTRHLSANAKLSVLGQSLLWKLVFARDLGIALLSLKTNRGCAFFSPYRVPRQRAILNPGVLWKSVSDGCLRNFYLRHQTVFLPLTSFFVRKCIEGLRMETGMCRRSA